jgi:1,4-dihydroxy-2-naphthoate octaprenyltransferase
MSPRAWLRASRLPSQSYIALPLLLGQAAAHAAGHPWDWEALAIAQIFGLFDQLYIVYANDYADIETDKQNHTWTVFSGGSRALVNGELSPRALARAAWLMAALALACGLALALGRGAWLAPPLCAAGIALLWMYSYPPVRLSYRGGGELLQMLGVGLVLPCLGFVAQARALEGFPWALLAALLPLQLACAMTTALPDAPSDRASGKRTAAVWLGPLPTRALILALAAAALVLSWRGWSWPSPLDWRALVVPALAWLGALAALPRARAGSKRLLVFVFCVILINLSWQVGVIVALLGGG